MHTDALQPRDDASSDNDEEQATSPETTPSRRTPNASLSPVPSASVASDSCDVRVDMHSALSLFSVFNAILLDF